MVTLQWEPARPARCSPVDWRRMKVEVCCSWRPAVIHSMTRTSTSRYWPTASGALSSTGTTGQCRRNTPALDTSTTYVQWRHLVLNGGSRPTPSGRGIWESNLQPKHAIANCCCHLANANERFRFFPNSFGLVITNWTSTWNNVGYMHLLCYSGELLGAGSRPGRFEQSELHAVLARQSTWLRRLGQQWSHWLGLQGRLTVLHQVRGSTQWRVHPDRSVRYSDVYMFDKMRCWNAGNTRVR